MDNSLLIACLVFILVLQLGLLALYYGEIRKKVKSIKERIRKETVPDRKNQAGEETGTPHRALLRMVSCLGRLVQTEKQEDLSRIRKRLVKAGYHGDAALKLFFGSKVFFALALASLPVTLKFTVLPLTAAQSLALVTFCVVSGFYLPDLFVYEMTQIRKRRIFQSFPDALDLMVVCVEAGMGLDAAIKRVGDEMAIKSKILSEEFRLLSLELRAGNPRPVALRNLAMRTDLEDVSSLVTLLVQTDRFGTRVAQALRVHSDSMRTKRYQLAEETAAKLPVKMVFPLIFFIFPALSITVLGPALINLYRVFQNR